ncbi:FAD-dependent oxidoreductase, partial [Chloroflexota bacterium]
MIDKAITKSADVLVIGGGMAGCFASIRASEAGAGSVLQVDKGFVGKSGMSAFAAGVLGEIMFPGDDMDHLVKERTRYSHFLFQQ